MSARNAGFTLIEMLVAMAIFSFIGVAAYTLLASTGRLKETGDTGYAALAGMQLALHQMEEDFSQFAPRPVASGGREQNPAFDAQPEDAVIALTRAGWRNPLGLSRSGLQRVFWALDDDGNLVRRYRRALDDNDPDGLLERIYASNVDSLEFRYLDDKGKWQDSWPPESAVGTRPSTSGGEEHLPVPVPLAVEVKIASTHMGELNRVIPLH